MKRNYELILTMAVLALFAAGTPLQASEADRKIEEAAVNSYVFKNYLQYDSVKVTAKDGAVTLSGTVNQDSRKLLAGETVANLPGVVSVDNRVELKGDHPSENTNEWLASQVKSVIALHRSLNPMTDVYVEEGVVTLRGKADSEAQRELTSEYVKDVSGILGIRNEMTIVKESTKEDQTMQEIIDDASITAQVKTALLIHRSTSVLKTSVSTKEGVVTLGGKARNEAEKELAAKLVSDIFGVKSINNNMSVNVS